MNAGDVVRLSDGRSGLVVEVGYARRLILTVRITEPDGLERYERVSAGDVQRID